MSPTDRTGADIKDEDHAEVGCSKHYLLFRLLPHTSCCRHKCVTNHVMSKADTLSNSVFYGLGKSNNILVFNTKASSPPYKVYNHHHSDQSHVAVLQHAQHTTLHSSTLLSQQVSKLVQQVQADDDHVHQPFSTTITTMLLLIFS